MKRLLSNQFFALPILAAIVLCMSASPAWACTHKAQIIDWQCCWSVPKFAILAVFGVASFFVCFWLVFPGKLNPQNLQAPSPLEAFASTARWFCISLGVVFLLIFALVSDELLYPTWTSPLFSNQLGVWMNNVWQALAVAIFIAISQVVVYRLLRRG